MIPKHFCDLSAADYWPYLGAALPSTGGAARSVASVWGTLLPKRHLIATPTGRHAWWYFLQSLDVRPGDEILIPAFNLYVMVRLAIQRGLVPVFVDIDPNTLTMDVADLDRKVTARSRIVLVTHMFGHPANLGAIAEVCRKSDLLLFEDCAHAVGTRCAGEQIGQASDGALFSFGVYKLVNSFGGGLLAVSPEHAARLSVPPHRISRARAATDIFGRFLISVLMTPSLYGWFLHPVERIAARLLDSERSVLKQLLDPSRDDPRYRFVANRRSPFKPWMLEMHARQLARLTQNVARRRAIVAHCKAALRGLAEVELLDEDRFGRSNGSYFGVYVSDPRRVARDLLRFGIGSGAQEFLDCASLGQFSKYAADCKHARYAAAHLLRLPSYASLSDRDTDVLTGALTRSLNR